MLRKVSRHVRRAVWRKLTTEHQHRRLMQEVEVMTSLLKDIKILPAYAEMVLRKATFQ